MKNPLKTILKFLFPIKRKFQKFNKNIHRDRRSSNYNQYFEKAFHQGYFTPQNPEKYSGDIDDIFYRSAWEHKFCIYLDRSDKVASWSYEPISIPYSRDRSWKTWYYIPDFWVQFNNENRDVYLFEIKPEFQMGNSINYAKWEAASQYARKKRWKFKVLNENHLRKYGIMQVRIPK